MLHVFVETNWVIDFVSPFQESPSARSLLDHALAGRLFQSWHKDGSVIKLWLQSIYHDVDLAVQDNFDVSESLAPFENDSTRKV